MQKHSRMLVKGVAAIVVLALGLFGTAAVAQTRGGAAVVAQTAAPPNLDCHFNQLEAARNIYMNWCEGLVTLDEDGAPIAQLAEKWDVSPDGKTITFTLRHGIKFQNGKLMTSKDVQASIERYKRVSPAKGRLDLVEKIETPADDTVVLRLSQPSPWLLTILASPLMPVAVYPSELTNADGGKIENIGTGPYMLAEFNPTQYALLKRFDDYRPDERYPGATGFGGRRIAYFDSVKIVFMREISAQIAALEAGQIDVATGVPKPVVNRLANNHSVQTYALKNWGMTWIYVNTSWGPTKNTLIRQAIAAAVDADEIMAISTDGSYTLNHSWLYPQNKYWPGDIGKDMYNQKNPEKAKALLKQAGYAGEEIVIAATAGRPALKTAAVVLSEQLKKAGLNVKLNVYDHAAFHARRSQPDGWNLAVNAFSIDPYLGVYAHQYYWDGPKNWANVTDPEALATIHAAWKQALESPDFTSQMNGVRAITKTVLDDVWFIKVGDNSAYLAARANIKGFVPFAMPRLWNDWRQ
jgi:peptide/nickel transport system substrate-binding protein